ncbi:hypothetical protein [Vibrio gazogenes]|uniref:Uncharacterized protein n=1 Tax=Vibrio gazogenes TaxID=687 RepID=A0A1Z2SIE4_VIBGA|nr:hypothetical protein [Vibrio gazogenes]ASA56959.1 hypothetical protein BSQ33_15480 [Vibrio gazogenes]
MVNRYFILLLFFSSFGVLSNTKLNNTDLYVVPGNQEWELVGYTRDICKFCTSDIYVKSGQVKINNTWIEGGFNFP